MPPNVFKLRETGDLFTFKNGRPLLLQLGPLGGLRRGPEVLGQSGIDYDRLPTISVEEAVKRFIPNAHPNAFFDLAQTASLQDIISGGEGIRTLTPQEAGTAFAERRQQNLAYEALTPQEKETLKATQEVLDKRRSQGLVLNPNVQITPEKLAEFTKQAESEINPFYAGQLKLARESLLRSVGYSSDEILRNEQLLERKFGKQVRELGEIAAEKGFALSGRRQQAERELVQETQEDIESQRRRFGFEAGSRAREFAQRFGPSELTAPTLPEVPRVGLEGFERRLSTGESVLGQPKTGQQLRQLPFYELSPSVYEGLIGESEFQRRGKVRERASELEAATRQLQI